MKNLCGKLVTPENAYEVWSAPGWTWRVLKKYQGEDKEAANYFARWLCHVTSPMSPDGDVGDVYVREIVNHAKCVYKR